MGVWSCIDEMNNQTWEYVPLGIAEELKRIPDKLGEFFAAPDVDDTTWTRVISASRPSARDGEQGVAFRAVA